MRVIKRKSLYIFFFASAIFFAGVFGLVKWDGAVIESAQAANDLTLYGFAWSDTIGWINFNSKECDGNNDGVSDGGGIRCPAAGSAMGDYAVVMKSISGNIYELDGYAWSPNIGWISFKKSDTGVPPASPFNNGSQTFIAKYENSTKRVSGWARALSGLAAGNGGWDGWIKLGDDSAGRSYGIILNAATDEFESFAWGGGQDNGPVIGAISFNCKNQNVCGVSNYKITTNAPPTAAIDIQDASGASISLTNVSTNVYLNVNGSSAAKGIYWVRFCSDDTPNNDTCGGQWTNAFSWSSSSAGDGWDAAAKKKTWSFTTTGDKGVYVQVKDGADVWSAESKDTISVSAVLAYVLSVSKSGAGSGTVSSVPAGINCGADCSETYNVGTSVALTATPDANSKFTGWSGDVVNPNSPVTFLMNAAKNVIATFAPKDTAPTVGNINSIAPTDSEWCGAFGAPAYGFSWQYNDMEGDSETSFQFQVATDANFGNPVVVRTSSGLSNPSGTMNEQQVIVAASAENDKITYDKTYYWRVKVFNANKDSGWVNGGQFTTAKHQYPTVSFTWDPKYPSAKQKVNFTDKTVFFDGGGNRSWSWVFFDASPGVANTQNPNTKFNSNGVKSVALTATDADGFSCTYPPSPGVLVMDPLPGWVETKP